MRLLVLKLIVILHRDNADRFGFTAYQRLKTVRSAQA